MWKCLYMLLKSIVFPSPLLCLSFSQHHHHHRQHRAKDTLPVGPGNKKTTTTKKKDRGRGGAGWKFMIFKKHDEILLKLPLLLRVSSQKKIFFCFVLFQHIIFFAHNSSLLSGAKLFIIIVEAVKERLNRKKRAITFSIQEKRGGTTFVCNKRHLFQTEKKNKKKTRNYIAHIVCPMCENQASIKKVFTTALASRKKNECQNWLQQLGWCWVREKLNGSTVRRFRLPEESRFVWVSVDGLSNWVFCFLFCVCVWTRNIRKLDGTDSIFNCDLKGGFHLDGWKGMDFWTFIKRKYRFFKQYFFS